ncbi:MAG TPA: non-homologous end-joining DNA ligase [Acidimicrobiia bacterium]|nr:non-homologous end-joining DNA ligase [Acidimicrobiia bacterium]
MIRFGISGLPPEEGDDAAFLDGLVARRQTAFEFAFTSGFPWKEKRCAAFGRMAAERDVAISIHAPYFAILTSDDPEKAKLTRSALEHTMKLGHAFGSRVIVAHTGYVKGRTAEQLHDLATESLEVIEPKVRHLGVALGLEVGGTDRAFGTLGDIALIAERFPFVHPVVDWAHVHAMSRGALTTKEAYLGVFAFLRAHFPGWTLDPLHCQFTDNEFGHAGEIRHVPYGQGSLRVTPLVEAAVEAGMRLTLISEAREGSSHAAIQEEFEAAVTASRPAVPAGDAARPLASGRVAFPQNLRIVTDGDGWVPVGVERRVRLTNPDKPFFPGGETKGDLVAYYHSVAPVLLPHLRDRAIVLARFPDGADGDWFYEKQAPSHKPEWLPTAPLWSGHRGDVIDFVTAPDVESLMWIANLGAIEIHPWLSRVATADSPDFAIFDLDPAEGATWDQVVTVAEVIRVALGRLGLTGHPKTSGATGLHVYVPLDPVHPYERVRRFVETVGRLVVAADPGLATMEWDIPRRAGKVFIDHNQNVGGKTIASVYSVRPRVGAPVSTPLLWDEVGEIDPARFTIATLWERIARHGDLFAPVLRGGQRLDAAEKALGL